MVKIEIEKLEYLPRSEKPKLFGNSKDVFHIALPREYNEYYNEDAQLFFYKNDEKKQLVIAFAFETHLLGETPMGLQARHLHS